MLTDAQLRRIKANPNKKTPDKYSDTNGLPTCFPDWA